MDFKVFYMENTYLRQKVEYLAHILYGKYSTTMGNSVYDHNFCNLSVTPSTTHV